MVSPVPSRAQRAGHRWVAPLAIATCTLCGLAGEARAQGSGVVLPGRHELLSATGPALCRGEIVRDILVYSSAPTVAGVHKLPVLGDLARSTHATTRQEIVRGFLLLKEGDRCTELARAESERVLRAQPFIADATVGVIPVDDGVRIEVNTIDEGAIVFSTRIFSGDPLVRSLRFGNANLAGSGTYLAAEWKSGGAMRDGAGATFTDYQLFGKPYVLHLQARRAPFGGEWHTSLMRPFLTGLQRQAWRAGAGEHVGYAELVHPDSPTRATRITRRYGDAGAMARIGSPVRMALVGALLSHEREQAAETLMAFSRDAAPARVGRMAVPEAYESTRINAFVGVRSISFERVEGFDALSAAQDIPEGFQAGFVIGRGLERPTSGSDRRELFVAADVYAGRGDANDATRLQLRAQGARSREDGEWGRVVATGRVAHQYKPSARHTLEASADWALAWRPGLPMQLLLGAEEGGVRGYEHARTGGGRRAAVRLEHRSLLANVGKLGEFGVAAFADAGRVWRGDAPFGITTPVRSSLGLSVLAAVPARSARLWRLDFAVPLNGPRAGRIEIGFSNGDRTSLFWREPPDIASMRGRTVPASVFAWP